MCGFLLYHITLSGDALMMSKHRKDVLKGVVNGVQVVNIKIVM